MGGVSHDLDAVGDLGDSDSVKPSRRRPGRPFRPARPAESPATAARPGVGRFTGERRHRSSALTSAVLSSCTPRGRSSWGRTVTASNRARVWRRTGGSCCAGKHTLEAVAATLRDELGPTGITVRTIHPGAYDTGFNDRIAETTYRWHDDDAVDFTREGDIRAYFTEIMKWQLV
ncbi:SDR family NAD(P)-dependent oxidoreductase [Streptomyces sp. NPDC051985]|uniref:SDR family NAD(P)-dependent oxidoreductase n=1 Tax=Streptomyces sp. NPDC051985 TaxID=3155807 RepID=UPI0034190A2C